MKTAAQHEASRLIALSADTASACVAEWSDALQAALEDECEYSVDAMVDDTYIEGRYHARGRCKGRRWKVDLI